MTSQPLLVPEGQLLAARSESPAPPTSSSKSMKKQQKHEKGCQHEAAEQKGERTAMEDSCMQGVTALRAADATTAKVVSSRRPCLHIFDTGQSGSTMQRQVYTSTASSEYLRKGSFFKMVSC